MTSSRPPLRVLFYVASLDAGGAERQVLEMVRQLDRRRFTPILGLVTKQGPLLAEVPGDVPIHAFQESPRNSTRLRLGRLRRWQFVAQLLRREKIDVVYDRTFQATLDTGPATWWTGTPRISTVVADPQVQMDLYFSQRQWAWRRFAQRVYRTANIVIANSAGLRNRVIEYFRLPPEQVRVVPNVLNVAKIDALSQEALSEDAAGRFRILTVGRIDRYKGHRDLLEAIRLVVRDHPQTNILWQILGDGPERTALLDEARRLGLEAHIEWMGIVANPYPYYRAAHVFCLPSLTEGSPNVLLEALALGTPVISTDCPSGPREILEDGRWGTLVPMQDPAALAAAIADRIAHPETWQARACQAQPVIRERYDVETGVKQLEELLIEAAG